MGDIVRIGAVGGQVETMTLRTIRLRDFDGTLHVFSLKGGTPQALPGFPFHTGLIDGINPNLSSEPTVPSSRP